MSAWPHRRRGRPPPARGGGSDRRGPLLGVPKCLAGVRRSCPGSRQGPTWSGLPRRPPARLVVSVFVQGPTSTVLFVSFSLCFSFCSARYPAPLRQNEKRNEAPNPAKQRLGRALARPQTSSSIDFSILEGDLARKNRCWRGSGPGGQCFCKRTSPTRCAPSPRAPPPRARPGWRPGPGDGPAGCGGASLWKRPRRRSRGPWRRPRRPS